MTRNEAIRLQLDSILRHLLPVLDDPALTDLYVNGPGEGAVERGGRKERFDPGLSLRDLEDVAILAAALNQGGDVGADAPFAGGLLPGGHRVQIVCPPATEEGKIALAFRKPSARPHSMEEMRRQGAFKSTVSGSLARGHGAHAHLVGLYRGDGDHGEFLEAAAAAGLNIVFAGKQKAGKTSKLRSLLESIRADARVIPVQDLDEMPSLKQWDVLRLFYSKGSQSSSSHGAAECIHSCVRLGAEVLPFQEVRDGAAYSLLYALRSGIQVLTTAHSNSAEDTFVRLAGLVKEHPDAASADEARLVAELRALIDVVAYCVKDGSGAYRVEQVYYEPGMDAGPATRELAHA